MKLIKKIIFLIIFILFLVASFIVYDGYQLYKDSTSTISLNDEINSLKSEENYTTLENVPEYYKNAIISIEDHRFYSHFGIDIISMSRAIFTNIQTLSLEQGGSSITQQVAKNLYFSQEKKFTRKVAELFVALDLEKNYSKDEILEFYINTIYFGDGYYCIFDASKGYFDKIPSDLSLYEATLLAGVPNAPSVYSPTKNINLCHQRQKQVLNAMLKYEYINQDEYDEVLFQIDV